jgi:parallel beta-helix repeat protein
LVDGLLGDNPTADGVTLLGDRILLEGLTVRDSINGFRVEGSSNSLLRNVAYDNVVGFRISGNSNFLQRNRAFANRRDGFFLAPDSSAATMLDTGSVEPATSSATTGRKPTWLASCWPAGR